MHGRPCGRACASARRDLWPGTAGPLAPNVHEMMLDHYSQTKNLLVDYSPKPLGFF
jgi:hypothetical protein